MSLFKVLLTISAFIGFTASAMADSGTCSGKTDSGKSIEVFYYTNTWVDTDIEVYADIKMDTEIPATYALVLQKGILQGEVTRRSLRNDHLDFGSGTFKVSEDHASMSGTLGSESFRSLSCTYSLTTQ